jgi:hypothetical protein
MVVARCSVEHIAAQVGSTPLNVRIFEKICFDVRRYSSNRIWLRDICLSAAIPSGPPCPPYETRLLVIAFEGGWSRLQKLLLSQQSQRSPNTKADLDQFVAILAARALDYLINLEAQGVPPSERDVQLLILAQRMPMVALPPFSPSERSLNASADQAKNELDSTVKQLSPLARRRIIAILERIKSDAPMKMDAEIEVPDKSRETT